MRHGFMKGREEQPPPTSSSEPSSSAATLPVELTGVTPLASSSLIAHTSFRFVCILS
jgi:hypothetical protein